MLFLVFGSSGAGKTSALAQLRGRISDLAVHDFDEIGVPPGADTTWRQRSNELWVQRALGCQAQGIDILLGGQTPFGELLAAPSAPLLEAVSGCLIDCDDETRVARLTGRGPHRTATDIDAYLGWAAWLRGHARDPSWRPEVIREGGLADELHWERWRGWRAGDPRWRVRIIDSSTSPISRIAEELGVWVEDERALFLAGIHPLAQPAEHEE